MAERKRFLLRLSPALWEELRRWAAQELRSVNAQIEFLLARAVAEHRRSLDGEEQDEPRDGEPERGGKGKG